MRSYWSKNEGSLGESTIFFIRWVKFGIRWEKNIKIYGVFGWEHMRLKKMRGLWVTAMLKKGVFWALHTRHLQNGTAPPREVITYIYDDALTGTHSLPTHHYKYKSKAYWELINQSINQVIIKVNQRWNDDSVKVLDCRKSSSRVSSSFGFTYYQRLPKTPSFFKNEKHVHIKQINFIRIVPLTFQMEI